MAALAPERTSPTNKDVSYLQQIQKSGQLLLAPEFQRLGVWPRTAKAYLIDTILSDKPIPLLFFSKTVNPQTGRSSYAVVDGQQRLRAVFEFLDDRIRLPNTNQTDLRWRGRKYSELHQDQRTQLLNYDLSVVELKNYSDDDIRDIFVRMNRYVVKLNASELRHAYEDGAFKRFAEGVGSWEFWREKRVLTQNQVQRMRNVEFAAELAILLSEGPQDKKDSIELYYGEYTQTFEYAEEIASRLQVFLAWIDQTLPDFSTSRWRRPVDLYGLIGALDEVTEQGERLTELDQDVARERLIEFERRLNMARPGRAEARYLIATARQTDNIQPRLTRIATLVDLLTEAR